MKKFGIVMIGVAVFVLCTSMLMFTSAASQNSNSSTTTSTNKSDTRQIAPPSGAGAQQDFSKNTWELPADADKTKNPVPTSAESVAKGKELYLSRDKGNCVFCHGEAGSGNEATAGRVRRKPADISSKERMETMTDGELFWKISKGILGIMPAGEKRMTEEERWHVVNYIHTLVKEPAKP